MIIQKMEDLRKIIEKQINAQRAVIPEGRGFVKQVNAGKKEGYIRALEETLKTIQAMRDKD